MNQDTFNKNQNEKNLDIVETVSIDQSVELIGGKTATDNEIEDLIVNNLALYFVSLARSMQRFPSTKKSS